MHEVFDHHAPSDAPVSAASTRGLRSQSLPKLLALLLGCSLVASACVVPFGGDDEAGEVVAADGGAEASPSTTVAADGATTEGPADAAADAAAPAGDDTVGRTGPIRDLPFFAAWADTDLHPFLVEVMAFPPEVPVPGNSVLTYVSTDQSFWDTSGQSRLSYNLSFLPMFDRDEFKSEFLDGFDPAAWVLAEQEEDLENDATRLVFNAANESAEFSRISFTYTDGDSQSQPEIDMWVDGQGVDGRPDIITSRILWPWVDDITVDPTMWNRSVSVTLGWFEGDVSLDRRWEGPVGAFEPLTAYFQTTTSADLVIGETEYSDSVWPNNEIDVTRAADGFEGRWSVSEIDAEDEVSINLIGRYSLE